ncbi:MAG: NAD(P)H-dependent oxidoreductase [Cognatishimia sp.]|uniref:NAD(P)H-dependent oxidoreductase n=1 Tax=Cognatishimia sp. TaxID=2211648 RepID=UPI003B8E7EBA
MTQKRIFVLNGHPAETSISSALTGAYSDAAKQAGHDVRIANLHDLDFDMDYGMGGYKGSKPLEPDLETVLSNIEWAEHVVISTPMWWGGLPAKLKGLFDRTLLPGRTFDTKGKLPKPMLGGRTGRVFLTSDTPGWYFRLIYRNALIQQLKKQILGFIGIKTKVTPLAGASHIKSEKLERWVKQAQDYGSQAI